MALPLELHTRMIVKECVWMNRPLHLERDEDGNLQTTFVYNAARCYGKLEVNVAVMFFAAMHDEHYDTEFAAAESMERTANLIKTPLALWRTERGRYFFVHASLNAQLFGCERIASYQPVA